MKKLIMLSAFFTAFAVVKVEAGTNYQLKSEWIHTSTLNISATALNPTDGKGLVLSVFFSTSGCTEFVDFRDTNTANTTSPLLARRFNVAGSTAGTNIGGYSNTATGCNGEYSFDTPIPFANGLSINASASTINSVGVSWYQNPADKK